MGERVKKATRAKMGAEQVSSASTGAKKTAGRVEASKRRVKGTQRRKDDAQSRLHKPNVQRDGGNDPVVVGIGASAGGLEALRAVLSSWPAESNLACVIAQHLDPKHQSMLTSLLARCTSLEVDEAMDGQSVHANRIYITPSGKDVTFADGRLHLSAPSLQVGPKPSIDRFFTSLAKAKRDMAVGIILSGTGSDGAHGMRAIKAEGGITIVQDTATAKYDGMPRASIETGHIDLVLPPETMGAELVALLRYPQVVPTVPAEEPADDLQVVFRLLGEHSGCDFSEYKLSTIRRRIERRMAVHKLTELAEYVRHLRHSRDELGLLFKDILISVTSFFRDPEAFEAFRRTLPKIIEGKQPREDIRIWVPGCATGEEAYSIAILLAEELGDRINNFNVQVFGTDIDVDAIANARRGIYPEAVFEDMDPSLTDRYFSRHDNTLQVAKTVREMVVFARQDLAKDPPFSHLDAISCRNVLIYFNTSLQQRLLPVFHYALVPGGYLFLGKSESIGGADALFSVANSKWKIYRRRTTASAPAVSFPGPRMPIGGSRLRRPQPAERPRTKDVVNQAIAAIYGHPAVLIDDRQEVVHVRGDVNPYVSLPPGDTKLHILTMAHDALRIDLRALIHKSAREGVAVSSGKLPVSVGDQAKLVTLHVRPVSPDADMDGATLVLFEVEDVEQRPVQGPAVPTDIRDPRVAELEDELTATRQHLHTTIQELETANEELQSLNEELQSANEELQSSNEELETANEELQSTNEELTTVNQELQVRSGELAAVNCDLENVLQRVGVAMVIVDRDLRVTRFTPPARQLFSLSSAEVGQVLTSVPMKFAMPNLREHLMRVVEEAHKVEVEITADESVYLMRLLPYYSEHRRVRGVVLSFLDRTAITRTEHALRKSEAELKAVFDGAPIAMILLDEKRQVRKANRATVQFVGRPESDIVGDHEGEALGCLHALDDLQGCGWGPACETCAVHRAVTDTLESGQNHYGVETILPLEVNQQRVERKLRISTASVHLGEEMLVLVCIEDISDHE